MAATRSCRDSSVSLRSNDKNPRGSAGPRHDAGKVVKVTGSELAIGGVGRFVDGVFNRVLGIADGRRFIANTRKDAKLLQAIVDTDMLGATGQVAHADGKNIFSLT